MPDGPLASRVAWVTGGSSGIGHATVARLASLGAAVGVLDLNPPEADVPWVRCDVADSGSVDSATAALARETGHADILVSSAGVTALQRIAELDDATWNRILAVNLSGAMYVIRACLPFMTQRGWGRIITVGSAGAVRVQPARAAYASSKAALVALTKVAALEAAPFGVTANVVAPGLTDTQLAASVHGSRDALVDVAGRSVRANPMEALLEPAEVAGAIAYLCSEDGRHMTGQVLHVNAGGVM